MTSRPVFRRLALLTLPLLATALLAQPVNRRSRSAPPSATEREAPAPAETAPPPEIKVVATFDRDGDRRLDAAERQAALAHLAQHPAAASGPKPRNGTASDEPLALAPVRPGAKLAATDTPPAEVLDLFAAATVLTVFLDFDDDAWEPALRAFAATDVQIPATLTVGGRQLEGVGVHARALAGPDPGPGYKRSLDLALDFTSPHQRLAGERRLQLVAARNDATQLRTALYHRLARDFLPAPRTAFVRLVINREDWGLFTLVQAVDEPFAAAHFGTGAGARWRATRDATLAYLGDDPAAYRAHYDLLTPEDPAAWTRLIELCRTLEKTPATERAAALAPLLEVDDALRFLALENVLINQDGYRRAGRGFALLLDAAGRFHLVPEDAESSFRYEQTRTWRERRDDPSIDRPSDPAKTKTAAPAPAAAGAADPGKSPVDRQAEEVAARYLKSRDFPKRTNTDLAMLLSYSFVNKVDRDENRLLSRTEWLDFAASWFRVMDEDYADAITPEQFTASVRNLVTPRSMTDGQTRQTFGEVDVPALIGTSLFAQLHQQAGERMGREEFLAGLGGWFDAWLPPQKSALTQATLQSGLAAILPETVFQADRSSVALAGSAAAEPRTGHGPGDRAGGGRGVSAGAGLSLGPIPVGLGRAGGRPGRDGNDRDQRTVRSVAIAEDQLEPEAGRDGPQRPLFAQLLAVPALRMRYFGFVRALTDTGLDWTRLEPIAREYHSLIAEVVRQETHPVSDPARFAQELDQDISAAPGERDNRRLATNLKDFVTTRRAYLLSQDLIKYVKPLR